VAGRPATVSAGQPRPPAEATAALLSVPETPAHPGPAVAGVTSAADPAPGA
jgi:hypothetical protein